MLEIHAKNCYIRASGLYDCHQVYVLLSCEISYLFKKSLGWVDVDTKISSLNIHIFFYVGVFPGAQRFGRGCIPFQGNLLLLFHA